MDISIKDKETLIHYINNYADLGATSCGNTISIEKVLEPWRENKCSLFKTFGNELIISKEIEADIDEETLRSSLYRELRLYNAAARSFWDKYTEWLLSTLFPTDTNLEIISKYYSALINVSDLLKNRYTGETFYFVTPDDKKVQICHGAKMLKVIKTLNKHYNFATEEEFEQFRLVHSHVLTTAKISGTLSLSIHPLDFLTMSDNDNDWCSCMSWKNDGEYRIGTVEMMNSPCVIVAYFTTESNNSYNLAYNKKWYTWNNKIWRCLYVVDPRVIAEVRQYPYNSDILNNAVIEWLRQLMERNSGVKFCENASKVEFSYFTAQNLATHPISGKDIVLSFNTNEMYNDFRYNHTVCLAEELQDSRININYSGPTTCMICGQSFHNYDIDDDYSRLICPDCSDAVRCNDCGDICSREEMHYTIDGYYLCSSCYGDREDE